MHPIAAGKDKSEASESRSLESHYETMANYIKMGDEGKVRELLRFPGTNPNHVFMRSLKSTGATIPLGLCWAIRVATAPITAHWEESLLDIAIVNNKLSIVRLLVESGALVNKVSSSLYVSPLFLAISLKHEEIAVYLIEKNADVKFIAPVLIKEVGKNTLNLMNMRCGVAPDSKVTTSGVEPIEIARYISILHVAAIVGCSSELVSLLMQKGADRSISARFIARTTSEHMYQNWCTGVGILAQLVDIVNACGFNIYDHMMSPCRPGIHFRAFMDSVPVDIAKLPWQLAKDFGHTSIVEMLKPSSGPIIFASNPLASSTGAGKEEAKPTDECHAAKVPAWH